MANWRWVTVAAALLVGCGLFDSEGRKRVKYLLNDPDSAKFSGERPGAKKGDLCGYVNAKNRMGGYVGDTPFVYEAATGMAFIVSPPRRSDFQSYWLALVARHDRDEQFKELYMRCDAAERYNATCGQGVQPYRLCDLMGKDRPGEFYEALKAEFEGS